MVGITRVQQLCEKRRNFKPIVTPTYQLERQPIEKLLRDIIMYVSRQFADIRSMNKFTAQLKSGFCMYSTVDATVGLMQDYMGIEIQKCWFSC